MVYPSANRRARHETRVCGMLNRGAVDVMDDIEAYFERRANLERRRQSLKLVTLSLAQYDKGIRIRIRLTPKTFSSAPKAGTRGIWCK